MRVSCLTKILNLYDKVGESLVKLEKSLNRESTQMGGFWIFLNIKVDLHDLVGIW